MARVTGRVFVSGSERSDLVASDSSSSVTCVKTWKEMVLRSKLKIRNFGATYRPGVHVYTHNIHATTDEGAKWKFFIMVAKNTVAMPDHWGISVSRELIASPNLKNMLDGGVVQGTDKKKYNVCPLVNLEATNPLFNEPIKVDLMPGKLHSEWRAVQQMDSETLQFVEGTLTLTFTLIIKQDLFPIKLKSEYEFSSQSAKQLGKDFGLLLLLDDDDASTADSSAKNNFSDVKIVSKDGKKFGAHKAILAARSPVFGAMFRSDLVEARTGVVQITDISGNVLKIVLTFIYTGVLAEEWSHADILEEFTYAVSKYQLNDLIQFTDDTLGKICTDATVLGFLKVAEMFSLQKAEKECMKYFKFKSCDAKSYSDLAKFFEIE